MGALVVLAIFLVVQQMVIRESENDLTINFYRYVFSDTEFPWTYFPNGRAVTRFLFPVRIKVTFYDAQYNEVTSAQKPGRYGAVIRIGLNGGVTLYRYVTLYRTPQKIYWGDGPGSIGSVTLPDGTGIDPVVEQNQQPEICPAVKDGFFGPGDSEHAAVLLAGLSETSPTDPAVDRTNAYARDSAWWYGLRKKLGLATKYRYLTFLPDGYDTDPNKKWPLVLSLHSNAGAGSDMHLVSDWELPGHIKDGLKLPAVVIAPQCPRTEDWSLDGLLDLLDQLPSQYRIDPDRIYIVGDSGGGDMTLMLASAHPERFAAVVTCAGEGDNKDAARIKDLPYWAFEGTQDNIVMPVNVSSFVDAVHQAGGTHAHLTMEPGVGHPSWDKAFDNPVLWNWLFAQKRGQPEVATPGVP